MSVDVLAAVLADVAQRLERIEQKLDALARPRRRPSRRALVAAIYAAFADHGDYVFDAQEVVLHSEVDPALRRVLDAAHVESVRDLGAALRALEGRAIDGLRLTRVCEERQGIIWYIARCG